MSPAAALPGGGHTGLSRGLHGPAETGGGRPGAPPRREAHTGWAPGLGAARALEKPRAEEAPPLPRPRAALDRGTPERLARNSEVR